MNLWSHHVVIYTAGSAFMNGFSSQGTRWCVLCARVEFHRKNSYQYLPKQTIMILERITKMMEVKLVVTSLIDHKDREVSRSRIPTKMVVSVYLEEATTDLAILKGALSWDLGYFLHCLLWILHGMIFLVQIDKDLVEMQLGQIQEITKIKLSQIFRDSWLYSFSSAFCHSRFLGVMYSLFFEVSF